MTSHQYDTFLSYKTADKPAVEALARRLRDDGISPWLDEWNLIPGKPWQEAIEQALDNCATCCVFIGPTGIGRWQKAEVRSATDERIEKGDYRVIPVLLPGAEREQRGSLPKFLRQTTWVEFRDGLEDEEAFRRLVCGIRGRAPGPGAEAIQHDNRCPYRGLEFFDVEHVPYFFGREALTEWCIDALRPRPGEVHDNRFLAIIGPSGSGKSSLARAGLIASLQRGALPGSESWPAVILTPGHHPLENLAVALKSDSVLGTQVNDAGDLIHRFAEEQNRLHLVTRLALSDQGEDARALILVDQFEELFTLCTDEGTRRAFIANVMHAATDTTGQALVVLTLRADFYGQCAIYDHLAAVLSEHQYLVSPPSDAELRETIIGPAQSTGYELEPGLVEMLVNDVRDQSGGLPLLEYALTELWEKRAGNKLRVEAYREMGGVQGAITTRAEQEYRQLNDSQQAALETLMLQLVRPGEDTPDTRQRAVFESDSAQAAIIHRLADAHLVVTDKDAMSGKETVEVAHEALIRHWPRLREWIEMDRAFLRTQARLKTTAQHWQEEGESSDYLLPPGRPLAEGRALLKNRSGALDADVVRYVRASIRYRRKRLTGRLALTALVILMLGGGVGGYSVLVRHDVSLSLFLSGRLLGRLPFPMPEMVDVQAGSFDMGSPDTDIVADADEQPQHKVMFEKPFRIGRYEVTFEQYEQFVEASPRRMDDSGWGKGTRPAINVSFEDAIAYAKWLSLITGEKYRLPSEAEWEYAARGGHRVQESTRYWWGDEFEEGFANCSGCGSEWDGNQTAPVGSFEGAPREHPLDLQDTAGNVWEWVEDCWHDNFEEAPHDGQAWHEEENGGDCDRRVIKGGSWLGKPTELRSAFRNWNHPGTRYYDVGFRLVQDL